MFTKAAVMLNIWNNLINTVSNLNWHILFDYVRGFGLRVGLRNEYDSTLSSKNDLDCYVSIIWDFQ